MSERSPFRPVPESDCSHDTIVCGVAGLYCRDCGRTFHP